MEVNNAIFLDLAIFGRKRFFKMAIEKLWTFVWGNSKIS